MARRKPAKTEYEQQQQLDARKKLESTRLLKILQDHCSPFLQPGGEIWVTYGIGADGDEYGHVRLGNVKLQRWLAHRYWTIHRVTASTYAVNEALLAFAGFAEELRNIQEVYLRMAWFPDDTGWAVKIRELLQDEHKPLPGSISKDTERANKTRELLCYEHEPLPGNIAQEPTGIPGALVLDLGDCRHGVVVTADGWQVIKLPKDIAFYRPTGYKALPMPVPGGSLDELRQYLNCPEGPEGDRNFRKMIAWVIGCYQPDGSQPGLELVGPTGAGKTHIAETLRLHVDPNQTLLSKLPKSEDDVIFQGTRSWVVGFDNLEEVPVWMSNALCRLSTGEGDSKRKLYTDDDPYLVQMKRPVIFTGINPLIPREDMASRYFVVSLPEIKKGKHGYAETEYTQKVKALLPRTLGALMDVLSYAIGHVKEVYRTTQGRYRLGDFHLWLKSAEPALGWPEGTADTIMEEQNAEALRIAIDQYAPLRVLEDLLREGAQTAQRFGLEQPGRFRGKAETLLVCLTRYAREVCGVATQNDKVGWPQQPKKLASMLRGSTKALNALGIEVRESVSHHNTVFEVYLKRPGGPDPEASGLTTRGPSKLTRGVTGESRGVNKCSHSPVSGPNIPGPGESGESGEGSLYFCIDKEKEKREESLGRSDSPHSPHSPNPDFNRVEAGESKGESDLVHSPDHKAASIQDFTEQAHQAPSEDGEPGCFQDGEPAWYRTQGKVTKVPSIQDFTKQVDTKQAPREVGEPGCSGEPGCFQTQGEGSLSVGPGQSEWRAAYELLPTCSDGTHDHSGPICLDTGLPVKFYPDPLPLSLRVRFRGDSEGVVMGAQVPPVLEGIPFLNAAICALALKKGREVDPSLLDEYRELVQRAEQAHADMLEPASED